ncbi:hypothetical protein AAF712_015695 [Marasmius tenuissimus]|uniref:Uncharacterized protein n=1 Tax=Marasmius tenuissimus TaxID=585030 RepID=A0ABR2Z9I7_9AGAR
MYIVQEDWAGLYKNWAPPFDSQNTFPKTKADVVSNVTIHQLMAQAYARARECQELYGLDEDDENLDDDPDSPRFNESQKEVERYLEYIQHLPPRPKLRARVQSEPSPLKIEEAFLPRVPASEPATPPRRRWRRYLSLQSAKPPSLSPVKLWKRTTSLPTTLSSLQFPVLPRPPLPSVSLSPRAPFARFRRTRSCPTPVKKEDLHRVESAPTCAVTETCKAPVAKKARRWTVNDGDAAIARARRENFGSTPSTSTLNTPSTSALASTSTSPALTATPPSAPSTPKRRKRGVGGRCNSFDGRQLKFPTKPVPLRLDLTPKPTPAPSAPNSPTTPPMPSSPMETTATCPYSIRQRPLPPDEWFAVAKAPAPEPKPEEKVTTWDVLFFILVPIVALLFIVLGSILALPLWCVCTPLGWVCSLFWTPIMIPVEEKVDEEDLD